MSRGTLRVYLGAAPGVGKTFHMLDEGHRRRSRGTDVVVGYLEDHGRPRTRALLDGHEVIPRQCLRHRGVEFEEMDVDAILARRPQVALIDELAHTNIPGSRNTKRWEDVEELLAAGIHVVSTVNIQHLESLNDVVEHITGVRQRETIPDHVVRSADQIELVDMTPEALRRRMAHGNIYAADKVDTALGHYFRVENLAALRELALLWLADRVDDSLQDYKEAHGIVEPWETRERVLVAVSGAPGGDAVIRRASRIAARARAPFFGLHIVSHDGLKTETRELDHQRKLLEALGGEYREVVAADIPSGLVQTARAENITQIVLGSSRRSRVTEFIQGSVINSVIRNSGHIDVHVISVTEPDETAVPLPRRRRLAALSPRRRLTGFAIGLTALPALTVGLRAAGSQVELTTVLLLYLGVSVGVAAVGGVWPGVLTAVGGSLTANWFFTPPVGTWTIGKSNNAIALAVFVVIAIVVSVLADLAARRGASAARARAESAALARLASVLLETDNPMLRLVTDLRAVFGLESVAVLRADAGGWTVEAAVGDAPPTNPADATDVLELSKDTLLALKGPHTPADDRRILAAFAAQLAVAVSRRKLEAVAADAVMLREGNRLRTALLAAVSHDLRTPLASIKASATSLLRSDVDWSAEDAHSFVQSIVTDTDRLNRLVGNLLDMSRLQTGAVESVQRPVHLEEIVPAALDSLGPPADNVLVEVADTLPPVLADPILLERVLANLVGNALGWSPPGTAVWVEAGEVPGGVDIRVVDRGPGIPLQDRERVFLPFQRLGDASGRSGVGLGLAVARGFTEAMSGELTIDDTPGGGTTMVVRLKVAP